MPEAIFISIQPVNSENAMLMVKQHVSKKSIQGCFAEPSK